jgi:hypothetical protein
LANDPTPITNVRDDQADDGHAAKEAEERGHEARRLTAAERSPSSPPERCDSGQPARCPGPADRRQAAATGIWLTRGRTNGPISFLRRRNPGAWPYSLVKGVVHSRPAGHRRKRPSVAERNPPISPGPARPKAAVSGRPTSPRPASRHHRF